MTAIDVFGPARGAHCIDELFAFIAVQDGHEGVCAFLQGGKWIPMVGADQARVEALRPYAQALAKDKGIVIRLCRFSARELLEEIKP